MKILIVDDEQNFLCFLKERILDYCQMQKVTVYISTATDPRLLLDNELFKSYDIIFLDIEMPNISGIEVAEKINESKQSSIWPFIIYVTNREGLVFKALQTQPYSFIRKSHIDDIERCLSCIITKYISEDSVCVKTGRTIIRVALSEIIMIEKEKNYAVYYTRNGEYRERSLINELAGAFLKKNFVRPNIGCLVNCEYISEILTSTIKLTDGKQVPLSRKYRKEVNKNFYDWLVTKI